jgi:signal transduction histidine kinase
VYGLRWEVQRLAAESDSPELVAGKLAPFRKALDEAEQSLRGSIDLLRSVQGDLPFISQIQAYLSQIESSTGIQGRLEAENEPELDEFVKIQVLNIIAEALRNISKHSNASEVTVSSFTSDANLQIKVADNGIGFDQSPVSGHGLTVMKERAESLGGWLKVISANGMGTRILLEVPRKSPAGITEVLP